MGSSQSGSASRGQLALTPQQLTIVIDSWTDARSGGGSMEPGRTIFLRIRKFSEPVGDMFDVGDPEGTRINVHAKTLTQTMDKLIKVLRLASKNGGVVDDVAKQEAKVALKIMSLGKKHVGIDGELFSTSFWKLFEQAILDCALEWCDSIGADKAASKGAWEALISYFMTHMEDGYNDENNQKRG